MARKSFKDNPALQFISAAENEKRIMKKAPEGYKVNPVYVETKTRRLQLVLQPSLFEKVKSKAKSDGLSVNEYIHRILDEATKEE